MAGQNLGNAQLEALAEEFAKDRQKEKYAAVMGVLESSTVLVPIMPLQGLDEETKRLMREGKPVRLPQNAKITPCLLRKESGEQLFPIFTSAAQIPPERRNTGVLSMPFQVCLSMVMSGQAQVTTMVLNPFSHNMVIPKEILEVAVKRRDAAGQPQTIRVTEKQFAKLVYDRVAFQLLPQYLFAQGEEGIGKLQGEAGQLLLNLCRECYPAERKEAAAVTAEDFSVMTMNVTENMQLIRVDMPEEKDKQGACYRIYVTRMQDTKEVRYYTLERSGQGDQIGRVMPDLRHETVAPAPENGAEIEAVMALAART